jgi:hypothetical protein
MGRPRASNAVRDFAALFAKSVTVPSSARYDWVARTGETSIFVLLSRLSPKVHGIVVVRNSNNSIPDVRSGPDCEVVWKREQQQVIGWIFHF